MKLLGLLSLMLSAVVAQPFRSRVDAVRVDVLVTEGNTPVAGLTAADFELRDNGVVQQIDALAIEDVPVSVMLVLDTSASVFGDALADLKRAAIAAIEPLDSRDRMALLTFSNALTLRVPWTDRETVVRQAIQTTVAAGGTSLWDAVYTALTLRDSEAGRRWLLLLASDGNDTSSWLPSSAVVDRARRTEAVVYTVTVGTPVRSNALLSRSGIVLNDVSASPQPLLQELTDLTGGQGFRAANATDLPNAFRRVISEFRTRYWLTFAPQNVAADGWHTLEVRLKHKRGSVRARGGYFR